MNIFAKATRTKLRFNSHKGNIAVEALWDLPVEVLKNMANGINRTLKTSDDLFVSRSASETTDALRLQILLEVIEVREEEKVAKVNEAEKESRKQVVKDLIAKKKLEQDGEKSIKELEEELAKL